MFVAAPFLQQDVDAGAMAAVGLPTLLCSLAILIIFVAAMWKIFTKAGKPGWYSIIPILNTITLLGIAGKPWWWLFLFFIPLVNFIILVIVWIDLAKAFGKGTGFGIGLLILPFIFLLLLAFGDAEYVGV